MKNYEYIISSLPALSPDSRGGNIPDFSETVSWIKSQCSESDQKAIDTLLGGWDDTCLDKDFYVNALSCKNAFIKEYFSFDLAMRNAKVRHINRSLGRPESQDIFMSSDDETADMEAIMSKTDILERERAIDNAVWQKIDEINTFKYFDLDTVLGFIAKLHIVSRWATLDEQTGRQMFRELVEGVQATFKGVDFNGQ